MIVFPCPYLIVPPERPAVIHDLRGLPSREEMQKRALAMTFPFPMFCPNKSLTPTLFDRTTGTNIGDMTGNGGLAASFDGNTNQTRAACSHKANAEGYVGKTMPVARPIHRVVVYSSNDRGFQHDAEAGAESYSLQLYGKSGAAPASSTNGTLLGSATGADVDTTITATINSNDTVTTFDHVWVRNIPVSGDTQIAELEIYVML